MSSNNYQIYTGVWTNQVYGPIRGLTLTLTAGDGVVLVAFLAVYVSIVGSYFWGLFGSILFRCNSSPLADGLQHQHQVILRNASSGGSASWQFLKTGWAWRKSGVRNSVFRSMIFATIAGISVLGFTAAGIFSSRITGSSSEVLLKRSPLCGDYELFGSFGYTRNTTPISDQDYNVAYALRQGYLSSTALQASAYAKQCSALQQSNNGFCTPIMRRPITFNTTITSECPFGDNICTNETLHMDSGMIDSLLDLGINSQGEDRMAAQIVTSCAPIKTEGYRSDWLNASDPRITSLDLPAGFDTNASSLLFYYGPNLVNGDNINFTFLYTRHASESVPYTTVGEFEYTGFLLG
jgi:hypothetical protein